MGFFDPLTEHDLRQAAILSEDGVLRSPAWTDEYLQLRQLHGCAHDFEGESSPPNPLYSRMTGSRSPSNGLRSLRLGCQSAHEDASTEHAPFMLARAPADVCRFGARYSDGSWVASGTGFRDNDYVFGEADIGSHTSAQLRMITKGSSGNAMDATAQVFLWPPPSDSIRLKFEWPSLDVPESTLEVPKSVLTAAMESTAPLDPE